MKGDTLCSLLGLTYVYDENRNAYIIFSIANKIKTLPQNKSTFPIFWKVLFSFAAFTAAKALNDRSKQNPKEEQKKNAAGLKKTTARKQVILGRSSASHKLTRWVQTESAMG